MADALIRRATVADAAAVAAVLNAVIDEGGLTIFDRPFSETQEAAFLASRGPRSVVHVAERDGALVGVQSVDLFVPLVARLADVATMGTWLVTAARGQGIGSKLAVGRVRPTPRLSFDSDPGPRPESPRPALLSPSRVR